MCILRRQVTLHSTSARCPPSSHRLRWTSGSWAASGVAATGEPANGRMEASLRAVTHRCPRRARRWGLWMLSSNNIIWLALPHRRSPLRCWLLCILLSICVACLVAPSVGICTPPLVHTQTQPNSMTHKCAISLNPDSACTGPRSRTVRKRMRYQWRFGLCAYPYGYGTYMELYTPLSCQCTSSRVGKPHKHMLYQLNSTGSY